MATTFQKLYFPTPHILYNMFLLKIFQLYQLLQQESHRAYGTADEALSTTIVIFKMFLF